VAAGGGVCCAPHHSLSFMMSMMMISMQYLALKNRKSQSALLRGRSIGRITCLACPSVRMSVSLSICPVRPRNSKTKKTQKKIKIGVNVQQGTSKWIANFQLKRLKVKVTGRQKPHECRISDTHVYLRATDQALTAQAPNAN